MDLDQLRKELFQREYENNIRIAPHMVILNTQRFLEKQFRDCEKWTKELDKCPSYERLMKFYEFVKNS